LQPQHRVKQARARRLVRLQQRHHMGFGNRDHGALNIRREAKAMHRQGGRRYQRRAAQFMHPAFQRGLRRAARNDQALEQRFVAMRPNLPTMQLAAFSDGLTVQPVGQRNAAVAAFTVKVVGGQRAASG